VGDLYATWRESGAGDTSVKPQRIADELGRVIDDFGVENIPGAVRARMESFGLMGGKQTKELTINEAEKLGKLIGNNIDPRNAPSAAALGKLKRAVDGAVLDTDAPDIPSLQAAKAAARERFSVRDSSPAIEAAAEGAQPDKFFSKYVVNGNVEELRGLKAALNTGVTGAKPTAGMVDYEPAGGQAWRDLQAQTLRRLMDKAQASPEKFGTNLSKAMKEIGDERLKVIFEPEQFRAAEARARGQQRDHRATFRRRESRQHRAHDDAIRRGRAEENREHSRSSALRAAVRRRRGDGRPGAEEYAATQPRGADAYRGGCRSNRGIGSVRAAGADDGRSDGPDCQRCRSRRITRFDAMNTSWKRPSTTATPKDTKRAFQA
jgi:hypothetical protein